jgi:hypothetical protein
MNWLEGADDDFEAFVAQRRGIHLRWDVPTIVNPLVEQYRARTLPNPHAPQTSPWWWRCISER